VGVKNCKVVFQVIHNINFMWVEFSFRNVHFLIHDLQTRTSVFA